MLDAPRPTDEQVAITDFAKTSSDNLMMNALAGCGKTSTLEMIERVVKPGPILYLVFNKRNAEEATERMLSTTNVRTFNSLGHRIWAAAVGKRLALDPKKSQAIFRELVDEVKDKTTRDEMWNSYYAVLDGVAKAKAHGYIPERHSNSGKSLLPQGDFHASLEERPDDLTSDLIDAVLLRSIKASYDGRIDFNDQIYMPALFGGTFPRFPLVKVDEYQDLNATNHAMLDKLAKNRIIGVGDPWQNIYGFRGAKFGGMDAAKAKFKMKEMDLSISFRCPKAIVQHVHWRVPHFKWIKEGGHVEVLTRLSPGDIPDNATILCRNNAPLFRTALHLLAHKRSVSVAGSDLGPRILGIMKKLGDESMSREKLLDVIEEWRTEKLAKESKTAGDIADCMRVFASFGATLGQAISYAEHLFAQRGAIQLMTGHKSKGLEFDCVYHLDPWILSDTEQDKNLRYVISTRSKDKLFEIDSRNIQW